MFWIDICCAIDGQDWVPMITPDPPKSSWSWLATLPIDVMWSLWVLFSHGIAAVLIEAKVAVAGAILWLPAVLIDAHLGRPVAQFGVIVVVVAAACRFGVDCVPAAITKRKACPW